MVQRKNKLRTVLDVDASVLKIRITGWAYDSLSFSLVGFASLFNPSPSLVYLMVARFRSFRRESSSAPLTANF